MKSPAAALVALALCLGCLAGAQAGSFNDVDYGQAKSESRTVRLSTKTVDGKSLGFTLGSTQTVEVYGGTAHSRTPLTGECGTIGDGASNISMNWTTHQAGKGKGHDHGGRNQYDCNYGGSLSSGTYAVKINGAYRRNHGPNASVASGFTVLSITGPANDARLSFHNVDAKSARVTASALTAGAVAIPLEVKVYRYGSRGHGAHGQSGNASGGDKGKGHEHVRKLSVLKASADDPRLASVALDPDGEYTVVVRSSATAAGASSTGAADGSRASGVPIVITVVASDDSATTDATQPTASGGSGGNDGSTAAPPAGDEPPAGNPTDPNGDHSGDSGGDGGGGGGR